MQALPLRTALALLMVLAAGCALEPLHRPILPGRARDRRTEGDSSPAALATATAGNVYGKEKKTDPGARSERFSKQNYVSLLNGLEEKVSEMRRNLADVRHAMASKTNEEASMHTSNRRDTSMLSNSLSKMNTNIADVKDDIRNLRENFALEEERTHLTARLLPRDTNETVHRHNSLDSVVGIEKDIQEIEERIQDMSRRKGMEDIRKKDAHPSIQSSLDKIENNIDKVIIKVRLLKDFEAIANQTVYVNVTIDDNGEMTGSMILRTEDFTEDPKTEIQKDDTILFKRMFNKQEKLEDIVKQSLAMVKRAEDDVKKVESGLKEMFNKRKDLFSQIGDGEGEKAVKETEQHVQASLSLMSTLEKKIHAMEEDLSNLHSGLLVPTPSPHADGAEAVSSRTLGDLQQLQKRATQEQRDGKKQKEVNLHQLQPRTLELVQQKPLPLQLKPLQLRPVSRSFVEKEERKASLDINKKSNNVTRRRLSMGSDEQSMANLPVAVPRTSTGDEMKKLEPERQWSDHHQRFGDTPRREKEGRASPDEIPPVQRTSLVTNNRETPTDYNKDFGTTTRRILAPETGENFTNLSITLDKPTQGLRNVKELETVGKLKKHDEVSGAVVQRIMTPEDETTAMSTGKFASQPRVRMEEEKNEELKKQWKEHDNKFLDVAERAISVDNETTAIPADQFAIESRIRLEVEKKEEDIKQRKKLDEKSVDVAERAMSADNEKTAVPANPFATEPRNPLEEVKKEELSKQPKRHDGKLVDVSERAMSMKEEKTPVPADHFAIEPRILLEEVKKEELTNQRTEYDKKFEDVAERAMSVDLETTVVPAGELAIKPRIFLEEEKEEEVKKQRNDHDKNFGDVEERVMSTDDEMTPVQVDQFAIEPRVLLEEVKTEELNKQPKDHDEKLGDVAERVMSTDDERYPVPTDRFEIKPRILLEEVKKEELNKQSKEHDEKLVDEAEHAMSTDDEKIPVPTDRFEIKPRILSEEVKKEELNKQPKDHDEKLVDVAERAMSTDNEKISVPTEQFQIEPRILLEEVKKEELNKQSKEHDEKLVDEAERAMSTDDEKIPVPTDRFEIQPRILSEEVKKEELNKQPKDHDEKLVEVAERAMSTNNEKIPVPTEQFQIEPRILLEEVKKEELNKQSKEHDEKLVDEAERAMSTDDEKIPVPTDRFEIQPRILSEEVKKEELNKQPKDHDEKLVDVAERAMSTNNEKIPVPTEQFQIEPRILLEEVKKEELNKQPKYPDEKLVDVAEQAMSTEKENTPVPADQFAIGPRILLEEEGEKKQNKQRKEHEKKFGDMAERTMSVEPEMTSTPGDQFAIEPRILLEEVKKEELNKQRKYHDKKFEDVAERAKSADHEKISGPAGQFAIEPRVLLEEEKKEELNKQRKDHDKKFEDVAERAMSTDGEKTPALADQFAIEPRILLKEEKKEVLSKQRQEHDEKFADVAQRDMSTGDEKTPGPADQFAIEPRILLEEVDKEELNIERNEHNEQSGDVVERFLLKEGDKNLPMLEERVPSTGVVPNVEEKVMEVARLLKEHIEKYGETELGAPLKDEGTDFLQGVQVTPAAGKLADGETNLEFRRQPEEHDDQSENTTRRTMNLEEGKYSSENTELDSLVPQFRQLVKDEMKEKGQEKQQKEQAYERGKTAGSQSVTEGEKGLEGKLDKLVPILRERTGKEKKINSANKEEYQETFSDSSRRVLDLDKESDLRGTVSEDQTLPEPRILTDEEKKLVLEKHRKEHDELFAFRHGTMLESDKRVFPFSQEAPMLRESEDQKRQGEGNQGTFSNMTSRILMTEEETGPTSVISPKQPLLGPRMLANNEEKKEEFVTQRKEHGEMSGATPEKDETLGTEIPLRQLVPVLLEFSSEGRRSAGLENQREENDGKFGNTTERTTASENRKSLSDNINPERLESRALEEQEKTTSGFEAQRREYDEKFEKTGQLLTKELEVVEEKTAALQRQLKKHNERYGSSALPERQEMVERQLSDLGEQHKEHDVKFGNTTRPGEAPEGDKAMTAVLVVDVSDTLAKANLTLVGESDNATEDENSAGVGARTASVKPEDVTLTTEAPQQMVTVAARQLGLMGTSGPAGLAEANETGLETGRAMPEGARAGWMWWWGRRPAALPGQKLLFSEEFDTLDEGKWRHLVTAARRSGDEFQAYRNDRRSSFVENGVLHLKPCLTASEWDNEFLFHGHLTLDNCTVRPCRLESGEDIVRPVMSSRIFTLGAFQFRYGHVEIRAKMPRGDWIHSAIWLKPADNAYGQWPRSGEIVVAQARGNEELIGPDGIPRGVSTAEARLLFGTSRNVSRAGRRSWIKHLPPGEDFSQAFHVFGLTWTPRCLTFSVDGKTFGSQAAPRGGFWKLAKLRGRNIWQRGGPLAPFDKKFFLIMNVAVGGSQFKDNYVNAPYPKPWSENSPHPARDFWQHRSQWLPTWGEGVQNALLVDYVRVYSLSPSQQKDRSCPPQD